jgi:hypothetical protein
VRNAADAEDLLGRWRLSGEGLTAWCVRQGVSRQSLQWWRRSGDGAVVRVAEVVVSAPSSIEYRVVLANGRELVLGPRFDDAVVRRLLDLVDP